MLNIAIDESNTLFRKGLELFLEEVLQNVHNESVHFHDLTKINAIHADIIVKDFIAGSQFICQPILKFRSKPGLIIGIYEGGENLHHDELPLCIKNIIFIARTEPVHSARNKVSLAWRDTIAHPMGSHCNKCLQCKYRTLTPQQIMIAKSLLHGNDILKISQQLGINVKTVSAHKRHLMSKFNLKNDCELLHFLKTLKDNNQPAYLLKD